MSRKYIKQMFCGNCEDEIELSEIEEKRIFWHYEDKAKKKFEHKIKRVFQTLVILIGYFVGIISIILPTTNPLLIANPLVFILVKCIMFTLVIGLVLLIVIIIEDGE